MTQKKDPSKSPRDTGGPVVKTGPTRGENRSRNEDGQWRKKRSDSGAEKKKSGCYLTTVACLHQGLADDCFELQTLRAFRDEVLMKTEEGRCLVQRYYEVAPGIAAKIHESSELDEMWICIKACLSAISKQQNAEAIRIYSEMTNALTHKYSPSGA